MFKVFFELLFSWDRLSSGKIKEGYCFCFSNKEIILSEEYMLSKEWQDIY